MESLRFLGAVVRLRKALVSFVICVIPFVCPLRVLYMESDELR